MSWITDFIGAVSVKDFDVIAYNEFKKLTEEHMLHGSDNGSGNSSDPVLRPLPEWEWRLETYVGEIGPIEGGPYDSTTKPMAVYAAWFPGQELLRVQGAIKLKSNSLDEDTVSFRIPEFNGPHHSEAEPTGSYVVPVSGYTSWAQRVNVVSMIENSFGGTQTEGFSFRFKSDGRIYMHFQSQFTSGESGASGVSSKTPNPMANQTTIGFDLFVPGGFKVV